jgi:hypothetical protein
VAPEYLPEIDDYTMSAGMARTPGGRIFLAWFGKEDGPGAVMLLAHSDDEGVSWSKPEYVIDPGYTPEGHHISCLVGNLWCAPDGKIWWIFTPSVGCFDGRSGVWAAICENPDDARPVWNKPFRIWHGCALNKPTVLASGEWALPVSLWRREWIWVDSKFRRGDVHPSLYAELDPFRGANLLVSNDHGNTWEVRGRQRSVDPCFDEQIYLEREDGSLVMYARDHHGLVRSESADRGWTWQPFRREWYTASARFFATKLPSGKWLMVRHDTTTREDRSHLSAFLSADEGKSWYGRLLLDERAGVSYPDGFVHPDGRIFIQYDIHRAHGEILMAVFTEADIEAGYNISGKAVFKRPLIQSKTCLERD